MPRRARIIIEDGEMQIYTAYDSGLVDGLRALPVRRWDADRHCWLVPEAFLDDVVELLSHHVPGVDVSGAPKYGAHRPVEPSPQWVDELFGACPQGALLKLYRALAFAFHPDVGGDTELMRRINLAYERRTKGAA